MHYIMYYIMCKCGEGLGKYKASYVGLKLPFRIPYMYQGSEVRIHTRAVIILARIFRVM